jgi:transposase-like protein
MSTKDRRALQPAFHVVDDIRSQIRERVRNELRDSAQAFVHGLFLEEVEALCGPAFSRKGPEGCYRGGSDPGSVILEGQRVKVKKARVKKDGKDVELQTYAALQGFDLLQDRVLKHMVRGVSTRSYDGLLKEVSGGLGLKKSSVSKAFLRGSRQALDSINGRDLSGYEWAALMIDGIEFAGTAVIVVLGITAQGKKLVLGLKRGDTENSETVKDLLQELLNRGLRRDQPFLFVLDGSKALRKAVHQVFGERFPVQRCVRHKERNALRYLAKSDHLEFRRRWKLIHGMARHSDARQHLEQLVHWLQSRNLEAAASIEEASGETLTVIELGASASLRKTLLSTNPIESGFDKVRARTNRVRRWRKNRDQIERWAAAALLATEKGFRAIRGANGLPAFIAEIRRKNLPTQVEAA